MGCSNIILLGSASAIATSSSSGYVFEWISCAKKITNRWPNIKICPLVPLWSDGVPGQFLRSVQEIGSVFQSLHGNDPRGLNGSWTSLTDYISNELCSSSGSEPDRYSCRIRPPCQVRLASKTIHSSLTGDAQSQRLRSAIRQNLRLSAV